MSPSDSADPDGLLASFLAQYSEQTRRAYRNDLENALTFLTERLGREAREVGSEDRDEVLVEVVSACGSEDLRAYFRREARSVSEQTLRRRVSTLRTYCGWLVEQGILAENPVAEMGSTAEILEQAMETASESDPTDTPSEEADSTSPEARSERPDPAEGESDGSTDRPPGPEAEMESAAEERAAEEAPEPGEQDVPEWIRETAPAPLGKVIGQEDPYLSTTEHFPLTQMPAAVRHGLFTVTQEVRKWTLKRGSDQEEQLEISIRPGPSVTAYIRARPVRIAVVIDDFRIRRLAREGPSGISAVDPPPTGVIRYLYRRGWTLPPSLLELIGKAVGSGGDDSSPRPADPPPRSLHEVSPDELDVAKRFGRREEKVKRSPRRAWALPEATAIDRPDLEGSEATEVFSTIAMEVVAALTEGFGMDRDERHLLYRS